LWRKTLSIDILELSILRALGKESIEVVKLPAHRAGLPGKEISFLIVPLDPAYKAGLAGHLPVNGQQAMLDAEKSRLEFLGFL
jgi:hypothetical protein